MKGLSLILLIAMTFSCEQQHRDVPQAATSTPIALDNVELYEAIQFVISDQHLDMKSGVRNQPISIGKNYLMDRVVDTVGNSSTVEYKNGQLVIKEPSLTLVSLRKSLTYEDVDFMLSQLEAQKNFQWDNARLGFTSGNIKEWYEFSIPLFSKDSSKVIIEMYWRCDQFLCGRDTPILLEKEQGHWTAHTESTTLH